MARRGKAEPPSGEHDWQDEIIGLMNRSGRVTKEQVVEAAEDPESALHARFTWDNSEAGRQFRLIEAGRLIRTVNPERIIRHRKITMTVSFKKTPAFVADPSTPSGVHGYRSTAHILAESERDPTAAREVVLTEFTRAAGALRRARSLAHFFNLTDEVDGLLDEIVGLRGRMEPEEDDDELHSS